MNTHVMHMTVAGHIILQIAKQNAMQKNIFWFCCPKNLSQEDWVPPPFFLLASFTCPLPCLCWLWYK